MVNLNSAPELRAEFEEITHDFKQYHDDMQFYLDAYLNNVFYPDKPNAPRRKKQGVNLLQVFADKLWDYHAVFPKISIPSTPNSKEQDDLKEKVLFSTHQVNESEKRWVRQTFDGAIMSCVITVVESDFEHYCPIIKRIDPRRAYWQKADANSESISTFWYVEPLTTEEILRRYRIKVDGSGMTMDELADMDVTPMDGKDYHAVITRMDSESTVKWVGNKLVHKPYRHFFGRLPAIIDFPIEIATYNKKGDFYLRKLVDLQAEFNEFWRQRRNIVEKLGNPTVWGRNIKQKQFNPVKEAMSLDGGFVGLAEGGELGLLQIPETKMIDNALQDCFQRMKDVAGFPTATFGEVVGANTSGDALGMYFQPTTRMIDKMNVAYKNHLVTLNGMILRWYATFLPADMTKNINGMLPSGKYTEIDGEMTRMGGNYELQFNKFMLGWNFNNVVTMNPVTPKDDINYKRLMLDAVREKMISRTTFYEELGFISPPDELAMLSKEQLQPELNPDGTKQILEGQQIQQLMQNPQLQQPTEV